MYGGSSHRLYMNMLLIAERQKAQRLSVEPTRTSWRDQPD